MEIRYRIWWKDQERYAIEKELESIYITSSGAVIQIGIHEFESTFPSAEGIAYRTDITDQVIVEQWIGVYDTESSTPIFDGDKVRVGGDGFDSSFDEELGEYIDVEEYYVEWGGDQDYPAFDLRSIPGSKYHFDCDSNRISHILGGDCRMKVVGTIHDVKNRE